MGQVTIQNPHIDEWITIDDIEYRIGKNFAFPENHHYAWNIYRHTTELFHIGVLRMGRWITDDFDGKSVRVSVWRETNEVYKCWMGIGLLKNKESLIGVVRGCIRQNEI